MNALQSKAVFCYCMTLSFTNAGDFALIQFFNEAFNVKFVLSPFALKQD